MKERGDLIGGINPLMIKGFYFLLFALLFLPLTHSP
jgi:hypothetical protein